MTPITIYTPERFGTSKKAASPSLTYKIDFENKRIVGTVDGIEALKQAIYLILSTERYRFLIYSWDFGIKLEDLYDQPKTYIIPQLQTRITDALMQDDRIIGLSNFKFNVRRGIYSVTFDVSSVFGNFEMYYESEAA